MIDLNELHQHITEGTLDKNNIPIILKNNKIIDFLLPNEKKRADETVEIMTAAAVLANVFELQ